MRSKAGLTFPSFLQQFSNTIQIPTQQRPVFASDRLQQGLVVMQCPSEDFLGCSRMRNRQARLYNNHCMTRVWSKAAYLDAAFAAAAVPRARASERGQRGTCPARLGLKAWPCLRLARQFREHEFCLRCSIVLRLRFH